MPDITYMIEASVNNDRSIEMKINKDHPILPVGSSVDFDAPPLWEECIMLTIASYHINAKSLISCYLKDFHMGDIEFSGNRDEIVSDLEKTGWEKI